MVGSIYIDSNNTKWITTNNGLAKLSGNNWTVYDTTNSGLPSNIVGSIMKDKLNNFWFATDGKGVVKYDGMNWTVYNFHNTGFPVNYGSVIGFDSSNNKWISGDGWGLLKFNDTNWVWYNDTNSGLPSNYTTRGLVKNNIVWIGSNDAGVTRFDGHNWTVYNHYNSGLPWNFVYMLNSDNYGNFWIPTFGGGVAKFNYGQNIWTVYNTENSGLHDNNVFSIYIDNNNVKWIGAGELAIFNDTTWQTFGYPFITDVFNFAKDKYGNMWICTSFGLFVYNPTGVIGIEKNQTTIPEKYSLHQNYPNPFNPVTKIKFDIPASGFPLGRGAGGMTVLKVYDILGKEIETLVNEKLSPGSYSVDWNASQYPSGVYFYRLTTEGFSETKKMILLK